MKYIYNSVANYYFESAKWLLAVDIFIDHEYDNRNDEIQSNYKHNTLLLFVGSCKYCYGFSLIFSYFLTNSTILSFVPD